MAKDERGHGSDALPSTPEGIKAFGDAVRKDVHGGSGRDLRPHDPQFEAIVSGAKSNRLQGRSREEFVSGHKPQFRKLAGEAWDK